MQSMNLDTAQYESASMSAISSSVTRERSSLRSSRARENFLGLDGSLADWSESHDSSSYDLGEGSSEDGSPGAAGVGMEGTDVDASSCAVALLSPLMALGWAEVGGVEDEDDNVVEDAALESRISRRKTTKKGVTRSLMP